MVNSEKLDHLAKVFYLMLKLDVKVWDVYCYVSAKEIQNTYENTEEYLAGWQEAENEQPELVANLIKDIKQYIKAGV